jgi:hypothetical protein
MTKRINVARQRNIHYSQHGAWIPDDAFDPTIPVSQYNLGQLAGTWYPSMDRCADPACAESVMAVLSLRAKERWTVTLPPIDYEP